MKIIDNINSLLGDDLKASIYPKAKLKIAASCFSIYAYEALKWHPRKCFVLGGFDEIVAAQMWSDNGKLVTSLKNY